MIERRLHRRFLMTLDVSVRRDGADWHAATTCDLSPVAVGLQLTRDIVQSLGSSESNLLPGERITLRFQDNEADYPDLFRCRVTQVRRISRDEYIVGAAFETLTTLNEKQLSELLARVAGPA